MYYRKVMEYINRGITTGKIDEIYALDLIGLIYDFAINEIASERSKVQQYAKANEITLVTKNAIDKI